MHDSSSHPKIALGLAWLSYFLANIDEINKVLQFFALALTITASIAALVYRRKGRGK